MSNPETMALPGAAGLLDELAEQYLSFRCRNELLALPIRLVREIIEYGHVTPVPMMPSFIRGVINLRGHVVPVLDLASRFGHPPGNEGRRSCIIVMELEHDGQMLVMGLVVDSVDAVLDIPGDQIEPPPRFGTGIRTDFIAGMARQEDGFIVILEVDRVLSVTEMKQVAAVAGDGDVPAGDERED